MEIHEHQHDVLTGMPTRGLAAIEVPLRARVSLLHCDRREFFLPLA
jgi:hypothetical protein